MANSALGGLLIVGALILIGLLLFSSTIVAAATSFESELNAGVAGFFKSLGLGTGLLNSTSPTPTPTGSGSPTPTPTALSGNAQAEAWFAFTLYFSDGTSQSLNMNPTFSLLPLSISWEGKTLTSMTVFIRLKVTGTDLGAWQTSTSQHIEVYFNGASVPATSSTGTFTDSGGSWTSGDSESISNITISSATLSSVFASNGGVGTWVFQTTGATNMQITSNGVLQTLSATMGENDITLSASGTLSISTIIGTHLTTTQLKPGGT